MWIGQDVILKMMIGWITKFLTLFLGIFVLFTVALRMEHTQLRIPPKTELSSQEETLRAPVQATSSLSTTTSTTPPLVRPKLPQPVRTVATPTLPRAETPGPLVLTKEPSPSPNTSAQASSSPIASTTPDVPNSDGSLNEQFIITLTNVERSQAGLSPLSFNKSLSMMAEFKSEDMIAKQYFAHVAPDGTDVALLAARANYAYLNLGENLAMGDFASSADVVRGWMNSPGHRANILSKNFTEIGVSAIRGMHEGRVVWYAVQEFGRPASDCTKPDSALQATITAETAEADALAATLAALRASIESGGLDQQTYQAKVAEYNTKVDIYNAIVARTKSAVDTYNAIVGVYNACIGTSAT